MPLFSYKVKMPSGSTNEGVMTAADESSAIARLKSQRATVIEISQVKTSILETLQNLNPLKPGIKAKDIVIFSRQLSTLVSAVVPLVQGLTVLIEQIESPRFKLIVKDIRESIQAGVSIADSMKTHPSAFSELYVSMIKAGEVGGILDVILERVSEYLEKAEELKSKVVGAMVYPAVIAVVAFGVVIFLLTFVIPRFAEIFTSFGSELPWPTRILLGSSNFVKSYIIFIILGIIGLIIGFIQFYKSTFGKYKVDDIMLKLPVFGVLLKKVAVSKFTRTLSTLVKSGIPILEALDTVAQTSGNKVIEEAIIKAKDAVREGSKISDPLKESKLFPPMVVQMIAVGEETGNLDTMLGKIADFYDQEVDASVKALTSMIEPLVIVVMGLVVGFIVIAMFMPMFSMGGLAAGAGG